MRKQTMWGEQRAAHGSVKAMMAAVEIGGHIPCTCPFERRKYYATANRLGIKIKSTGTTMQRVA